MAKPSRNIIVYASQAPAGQAPVEMCEHKGIGHPDTITDAVCEAAALDLIRQYEATFGGGLHFNVDKGLLVGGKSEPRFGGGSVLVLPKLIVCGRASNPESKLDIAAIVLGAARRWLDKNIASAASICELSSEVREGSASLREVFKADQIRANDTSFGVGFAPLSLLEAKVLRLAAVLGDGAFRRVFPAAGQDFKVMGLRDGAAMTFTVALAMVDRHIRSVADYFAVKDAVRARLAAAIEPCDEVLINRLDDQEAKDESGLYLTVTGLSAEMGDDGQVGRGNRVNGLITPCRAMSMEAAAGKNPLSHVGKIYNVLAHKLAQSISAQVPEVTAATVRILSAIGTPLDEPLAVAVEIDGRVNDAVRAQVRALVDREFDALAPFLRELACGRLRVY